MRTAEVNRCLFCGGEASAPDHLEYCDGRQGRREADELTDREAAPVVSVLAVGTQPCPGRDGRFDSYRDPLEPEVLDPALAHQVTEAAVARSGDHAPIDWREEMRLGILAVARRCRQFTSDDLWVEVGPAAMSRANTSALGSVFRAVAREGAIELTAEREESRRPATHRRPLRVWRSLVVKT